MIGLNRKIRELEIGIDKIINYQIFYVVLIIIISALVCILLIGEYKTPKFTCKEIVFVECGFKAGQQYDCLYPYGGYEYLVSNYKVPNKHISCSKKGDCVERYSWTKCYLTDYKGNILGELR